LSQLTFNLMRHSILGEEKSCPREFCRDSYQQKQKEQMEFLLQEQNVVKSVKKDADISTNRIAAPTNSNTALASSSMGRKSSGQNQNVELVATVAAILSASTDCRESVTVRAVCAV
jgi:hypothetical protein